MGSEEKERPVPTAPGYGDQGPAGAGRDIEDNPAAETEDEPEPVDDLGGRV